MRNGAMTTHRDRSGRPVVVVTGLGVMTSLGTGKADNWQKLTAGMSGIHAITRFATDGLKTRIGGTITNRELLRGAGSGRFTKIYERFMFASVADGLAETFGTKGSPITLSTACASGVTAIQLGVEAIRRGEAEAALCIGTDGSINPESLVRFSLLSALSTCNDPPAAAAKPFAKNRDGFVMAEGAAALVLESLEHSTARGGK